VCENLAAGWAGRDACVPDTRPATFRTFAREVSGTTAIEYALIAFLVSLSVIVGAKETGLNLNASLEKVVSAL
jgi:Flp pilus assembly pilin Flp